MKTVYLAGPIAGLDFTGAVHWRNEAIDALARVGIKGLSPMRAKEYLVHVEEFTPLCEGYGELSVLSSPRGIMTRDRFDATRCDVLLVNFLGADRVSMGTCMEIAWADLSRIPIVCCMEEDGSNPHEHGMINEAIGFKVPTLVEGLNIVKAILS